MQVVFIADVPPLGYAAYSLVRGRGGGGAATVSTEEGVSGNGADPIRVAGSLTAQLDSSGTP